MQRPQFTLKADKKDADYGKFIIEPLPKGFGHTLGNTLRRVLLSNLKGSSITKIKVEGLTHKFSTLEGLNEDTIDLILNLKEVKVSYDKDEVAKATLSEKGPKTVKAKDIKFPATVELVNPDAIIANISKGAKLEMELDIQTGYGYSPANDRTSDVIGEIPIDALYSPVERVSYSVESTRVGRLTDFDKLVIEIFTDGSQDSEEVLKTAAKIAVEYFQQVYDPVIEEETPETESESESPEQYKLSVEELGLPTRIANALKSGGYATVKDLAAASMQEMKSVKNLGAKSLDLVIEALKEKGVEK